MSIQGMPTLVDVFMSGMDMKYQSQAEQVNEETAVYAYCGSTAVKCSPVRKQLYWSLARMPISGASQNDVVFFGV